MARARQGVVEMRAKMRYNMRMNKPLKLIPIGNSTGVIIPKEMLQALGAEQGDSLTATKTPYGIELRAGDADFDEQMRIAREVMRDRRSALRELAK